MSVDETGIFKTIPTTSEQISTPIRPSAFKIPFDFKYNFPPTYEDPIDRMLRLRDEEQMKRQFNEKFVMQTGAIPKGSMESQ